MSARSFLDADMATLWQWMKSGFQWWCDQMAALLPGGGSAQARQIAAGLRWDGGSRFRHWTAGVEGNLVDAPSPRPKPVLLPAEMGLQRTLSLPSVNDRDLQKLLQLDADRIMPMPSGAMLLAGGRTGSGVGDVMDVLAIGLPLTHAQVLVEALAAHEIRPTALIMQQGSTLVDFLPEFRRRDLIAKAGNGAVGWWAAVAFLFVLNIGLLVWRDQQSVDALSAIVDAQRPMAMVAQRVADHMQADSRLGQNVATRRTRQDVLGDLAALTQALPDQSWVQRYTWDGRAVRLAGYRAQDADILSALRRSPRIADVRNANADVMAEIPAGQPFDIIVRMKPR